MGDESLGGLRQYDGSSRDLTWPLFRRVAKKGSGPGVIAGDRVLQGLEALPDRREGVGPGIHVRRSQRVS